MDRETAERVSRLHFKSRRIVEGLRSGPHKSPFFGSSVEFAEHKEYAPGDDLRHIDWKLYGKADRYYIKRYEEETNLIAYFLVDQSASMTYAGSQLANEKRPWWRRALANSRRPKAELAEHIPDGSKLAYSTLLTASLAHLLLKQGDQVGLMTFGGGRREILIPRSQPSHLHAVMQTLITAPQPGRAHLEQALSDFAPRMKQRGVVFLISDMLEDLDPIFRALKGLRPHRHDIVLLHVLDPDELGFPFEEVSRFEDPEDRSLSLLTDPRDIRDAYLKELHGFLGDIRQRCIQSRIDYRLVDTSLSVSSTLSQFLAERAGRRRGRR